MILKTNVVVIGGGVIGSSIAYHLARRSVDVILVERDDIASGTSGACDGFVFLQSKRPGVHLQMALESARMMERLSAELPRDIEYERNGGMILIKSEDDLPEMQRLVERQRKHGLDVELLDTKQAREMEPHLSPDMAGATYSRMDAQVNPIFLCLAFAEAAQRMGAKVLTHTEVTDVSVENGRIKGVVTSSGNIAAEVVVNAAGVHAPTIGRMLGIDLPITPRRGQVLVTEPVPRMLTRVMICSRYITAKFGSRQKIPPNPPFSKGGMGTFSFSKGEMGSLDLQKRGMESLDSQKRGMESLGVGLALEQTRAGTLLIGSTREFVGYDRGVTPEGIRAIVEHASGFVPAIRELNVIRAFAGLRPYTPDGLPVLGQVDGIEDFIVAAGHEGDGIALSPITGFLIAELIATGEMPSVKIS